MEKPSDFSPFSADPEQRLKQLERQIILDEAHQLPALFPVLRSYADENRSEKGMFVLLGSASPGLVRDISESLAGRTAFIELTPFLYEEAEAAHTENTLECLWFRGGFPDPFLIEDNLARIDWFDGYTRTFINRDLTMHGVQVTGTLMRRLWSMLAHFTGSVWNASRLASSLGINYQTVNRYTDILEQTFLIRKLSPFYANIGKRIVKSPKIYIRDTGLLHYFLGIDDPSVLDVHPSRGASWEAFLIEQICSRFQLFFPNPRFFFWRTAGGAEVDLIIQCSGRTIPFEIKLHSAPDRSMTKSMLSCMNGLNLPSGYIVYPGNEIFSLGNGITALPAEQLLRIRTLEELI